MADLRTEGRISPMIVWPDGRRVASDNPHVPWSGGWHSFNQLMSLRADLAGPGYMYAFGRSSDSLIKIGITGNMASRMSQHRSALRHSGSSLIAIGHISVRSMLDAEKFALRYAAPPAWGREWFRITVDEAEEVLAETLKRFSNSALV